MQVKPLYDKDDIRARVALGDQHAFALFFNYHWPQVYGTGLRLTKSPEKAQDLAQDIFIKLWENRHRGLSNAISHAVDFMLNYFLRFIESFYCGVKLILRSRSPKLL